MLLFFGSLLGFGMLILICMQQSRDLEQADREAALKSERDLRATSLSPASFPSGRRVSPEDENSIVSSVERYLQEQQAFAKRFIEEPSVESLYRRKEPEFFAESLRTNRRFSEKRAENCEGIPLPAFSGNAFPEPHRPNRRLTGKPENR